MRLELRPSAVGEELAPGVVVGRALGRRALLRGAHLGVLRPPVAAPADACARTSPSREAESGDEENEDDAAPDEGRQTSRQDDGECRSAESVASPLSDERRRRSFAHPVLFCC